MSRSLFTATVYAITLTLATSLAAGRVHAQAAAAKDKDKPAPPEDVKFTTKDGWEIHATYYPGKLKKNAVPFIMLHGFGGSRADYDGLAKYLQSLGHAAIVPDLRGHGQSNTRPGPKGETVEEPEDLSNNEIKGFAADVEACKKFLREKNNAGELNIEMLTVIGADVSCITALQWSNYDWNVQNLPAYKQGKDVKMVVLLSPTQSFKGNSISPTMTQPAVKKELTIVMIVGREDSKSFADARKMNTQLENFRPEMKKDDVKNEDRSLFFFGLDTNLTGTDLLNEALKVKFGIANIVKLRLSDKKEDFAWSERKNPLSGE
jgi:pimeloyl-ACP methyl ester carboxylesterase